MDVHFYKNLDCTGHFLNLAKPEFYTPLPDNWCIAVSDVRNSTREIKNGRFRDVNLNGASLIAAISNAIPETELPFSFGGDGSVIAFPGCYRKKAEEIIKRCRTHAKKHFNLDLAAGIVPISDLYEEGHPLMVAKFQTSEHVNQASFLGNGIIVAEEWVKQNSNEEEYSKADTNVDLSGLECRWNPFPADELAISLIVDVIEPSFNSQFQIYQSVLSKIYQIFDDVHSSPIKEKDMKLTFRFKNMWSEAKMRSKSEWYNRIRYFIKLIFLQLTGKYFMKYDVSTNKTDWGDYKPDFVKNSDYRKFSQSLKMVITGSLQMKNELEKFLDSLYKQGLLVYGIHVTDSTVTTCYVKEYQSNHIHFIDGTGGGYTMASIDFKKRLNKLQHQKTELVSNN
ncbi:DUF3095 family protein [Rhodohalobacter barkolensis]|uniref:DUF3095 domain-containing protein n=1 Tax=Rhodohalobacter barkolensis TaxID=2053187 RepID=A0A2N0VKT9_9BACT|nr:DUF3095 family protein [Rhodohalobacter barkolensis]PKD44815.1 hypothetical protein CWD77_04955 [Rhodohalobacter barkolensis]